MKKDILHHDNIEWNKIMKKKLIFCIVTMLMMLSFAACGKKNVDDSSLSDLEYVQKKGTLVVGITDFKPMDYRDTSGKWVGYDAELARMFADYLGVDIEFIEIKWDNKIMELDSKSVDCIWNGMTLTDEVKAAMTCSDPYCENAQVIVIPANKADKYKTIDDFKKMQFAVESGSAGQSTAEENGLPFLEVKSQAQALMEVKANTSDGAIIDLLMAKAMVGKGTSYSDLTYTMSLNVEEYGVGFRKGSDLAEKANEFLAKAKADGTIDNLAEKYWNPQGEKMYSSFKTQFPIVLKALNKGFVMTLKLFVITLLGAIPLGLLIQFGERSKIKIISGFFKTIIWIVRGTPLMIQLLILYYFPGFVFGESLWGNGESGRFWASAAAFIFNYACYFSVIFRGGIQSIPTGQDEAGFVLGMTKSQVFFKVKMLQMVKNVLPPMSNEILTLVKDTSLARIISMQEVVWAGEAFMNGSYGVSGIIWPLFFTAIYYLIFNGVLTLLFSHMEKKLSYFE